MNQSRSSFYSRSLSSRASCRLLAKSNANRLSHVWLRAISPYLVLDHMLLLASLPMRGRWIKRPWFGESRSRHVQSTDNTTRTRQRNPSRIRRIRPWWSSVPSFRSAWLFGLWFWEVLAQHLCLGRFSTPPSQHNSSDRNDCLRRLQCDCRVPWGSAIHGSRDTVSCCKGGAGGTSFIRVQGQMGKRHAHNSVWDIWFIVSETLLFFFHLQDAT